MCRWWLLRAACLPALPFACTLWWQPNVMALTWLTMETMTGGQGGTSAFSIYHPWLYIFFHSLFLLFLTERQGKSLHTLCFRLAWNTCKTQENKGPLCLRRNTAPPPPPHPCTSHCSEQLIQFIGDSFWLWRVLFFFFLDLCQQIPFKNVFCFLLGNGTDNS